MNSLLLDEADFARLHHLYHNESDPPVPSHEQRRAIGEILASSTVVQAPGAARDHVGFDDEIILSSIADEKDDFAFKIVVPSEADPAQDRISIFMPVSLAVIGRPQGSTVSWEANGALREMKIRSIRKSSTALAATA